MIKKTRTRNPSLYSDFIKTEDILTIKYEGGWRMMGALGTNRETMRMTLGTLVCAGSGQGSGEIVSEDKTRIK